MAIVKDGKPLEYGRAVKELPEDQRPREKAMKYGFDKLSKAELLAIIIGGGTPGESVVDLAQRILQRYDNRFTSLSRRTVGELTRNFKGIGTAKAIAILSAMNIGRVYNDEILRSGLPKQITGSKAAFELMCSHIGNLPNEEFWIVTLSNSKRVINQHQISLGGISGTAVDIKIILKRAVDDMASAMLLFHNHPSGNVSPSSNDKTLTRRIADAGDVIGIDVVDHIIISGGNYFSFADEGIL